MEARTEGLSFAENTLPLREANPILAGIDASALPSRLGPLNGGNENTSWRGNEQDVCQQTTRQADKI